VEIVVARMFVARTFVQVKVFEMKIFPVEKFRPDRRATETVVVLRVAAFTLVAIMFDVDRPFATYTLPWTKTVAPPTTGVVPTPRFERPQCVKVFMVVEFTKLATTFVVDTELATTRLFNWTPLDTMRVAVFRVVTFILRAKRFPQILFTLPTVRKAELVQMLPDTAMKVPRDTRFPATVTLPWTAASPKSVMTGMSTTRTY
jgi:hypothetical protein